jgi:hypothetical protein
MVVSLMAKPSKVWQSKFCTHKPKKKKSIFFAFCSFSFFSRSHKLLHAICIGALIIPSLLQAACISKATFTLSQGPGEKWEKYPFLLFF